MTSEKKWVCYLLKSVDSNKTYVGATNDLVKRLNDHCGINGKSRGAKYTKGEMWYVVLYVEGFRTKIECLSFEYQFKRMRKKRLDLSIYNLKNIGNETITKRIQDLFKLILLNKPEHKWNKNFLKINFENGENELSNRIDSLNQIICKESQNFTDKI